MDNLWTTIISITLSAIISGVIGYLVKHSFDKYFNKKEAEEMARKAQESELELLKEEKTKADRKQAFKEIVREELGDMRKELREIKYTVDLHSGASLSTLRNDILTCYYKCVEKGYRNDYDYTNIHDLYDAYVALHGNSFVEDIIKRFDNLPVKEEIKHVHTGV